MVEISASIKLLNEFKNRSEKNSRYSLRAFARDLGMRPSHLSEFFSNKRTLSATQVERIVYRLGYDYRKANEFILALEGRKQKLRNFEKAFIPLSEDTFSFIADWQNYAVLNLMRTRDFQSDVRWIAERLGLQVEVAEETMKRLERLELIERQGTSWVRMAKNLTTSQDIPSAALKKSHRQDFKNALKALAEAPADERDITSITMPIDPKKIALAKKMIRTFRRKLSETLESGELTEVYNLNIQLVPISRKIRS